MYRSTRVLIVRGIVPSVIWPESAAHGAAALRISVPSMVKKRTVVSGTKYVTMVQSRSSAPSLMAYKATRVAEEKPSKPSKDTSDKTTMPPPSPETVATLALNESLQVAVRDIDAVGGPVQVEKMLETSEVRFDGTTLSLSLAVNELLSHRTAHAKLAFAVRMLQRARAHNIFPEVRDFRCVLNLAHRLRKVNVVEVVKKMVLKRKKDRSRLGVDIATYMNLILHLSVCNKPALRDEAIVDLMYVHQQEGPTLFSRLVKYLLKHGQAEAANAAWKMVRAQTLSSGVVVDASILDGGALACAKMNNIDEMIVVLRKYKELSLTPAARVLQEFTKVCIQAKDFDATRALMRWTNRLPDGEYNILAEELVAYIRASRNEKGKDHPLCALADILVGTMHLGGSEATRISILRLYFKTLGTLMADGNLEAPASETLATAYRVFEFWNGVEDRLTTSHMVYLASVGKHLDLALRIVRSKLDLACRTEAKRALPFKQLHHKLLQPFALAAAVELSIIQSRAYDALAFVFDGVGDPLPKSVAAWVVIQFMNTSDKSGRLDLCTDMLGAFSRRYGVDVGVSNSYIYLKGRGGCNTEAIEEFQKLHHASVANEASFCVLGSVLWNALAKSKHGRDDSVSTQLAKEMTALLFEFLKSLPEHEDAGAEKRISINEAEPFGELAYAIDGKTEPHRSDIFEKLNRGNTRVKGEDLRRMRSLLSRAFIQHRLNQIQAQLAVLGDRPAL
ncbi:hypothetical protein FVE85_3473 [Porphyridium purpureum]|uniref:Uncharacterized protein n=1 Tax=Porphyridium purpureum TaxID=35688 RepID=A0A5J4YLL9_PORPP|nr:hypothetical protein FVE85_3473 [Porphyridium purpureum]|eukprot:POR2851..scf249_10